MLTTVLHWGLVTGDRPLSAIRHPPSAIRPCRQRTHDLLHMGETVGSVELKLHFQGDGSVLRVEASARPGVGRERFPEEDPTLVKLGEQGQRYGNVRALSVGQGGPGVLIVGLERGVLLGEDELAADVAVHVRIGQVMHILGHAPLAREGTGGELRRGEITDQIRNLGWKLADLIDTGLALGVGQHRVSQMDG